MKKTRLEAFSDAIIAIIMTIMVLEIVAPEGDGFSDLWNLRFKLLIYFLSFTTLAIYWNNHHHLFQLARKINGKVLWLNMVLLFFLSLFPLTTAWVDEHLMSFVPEITYGFVGICANISYALLSRALVTINGKESALGMAIHSYKKSIVTISINVLGIIIGMFFPPAIVILYASSLTLWIVPERRIEAMFKQLEEEHKMNES